MNQAIELLDYIKEMNKSADKGFKLTEDLDHWYGLGILTRDQLIEYLNDRKDGKQMWTKNSIDTDRRSTDHSVPRIKGDIPDWFEVAASFYWACGGENCNGDEDSVNYLIEKYNPYFEEADDE